MFPYSWFRKETNSLPLFNRTHLHSIETEILRHKSSHTLLLQTFPKRIVRKTASFCSKIASQQYMNKLQPPGYLYLLAVINPESIRKILHLPLHLPLSILLLQVWKTSESKQSGLSPRKFRQKNRIPLPAKSGKAKKGVIMLIKEIVWIQRGKLGPAREERCKSNK